MLLSTYYMNLQCISKNESGSISSIFNKALLFKIISPKPKFKMFFICCAIFMQKYDLPFNEKKCLMISYWLPRKMWVFGAASFFFDAMFEILLLLVCIVNLPISWISDETRLGEDCKPTNIMNIRWDKVGWGL